MNQLFEENIKNIQNILKKRILMTRIITVALLLLALFCSFLYSEYITYIFIIYITASLTFIIQLIFSQSSHKLNELLNTYQTNPKEVRDYLVILIKNAENSQHNFIMKFYYQKIIIYYIKALDASKSE